jgi:hypothetical protein
MARGIGHPCVMVEMFVYWGCAACHVPCLSRSWGLLVRGGDLSCEAETARGVPLLGNWSEILPTGREQDVLPVMVLTGVLSPPRLES